MKTLSEHAFLLARDFIKTQARPLERVLFELRFEGGPAEGVLSALRHFQNPDGGFGHALEPDMRSPSSSALATDIGLDILRETNCSDQHPMVQHAVTWLMEAFDPRALVWRVVPQDVNQYPHAPWWNDEKGSLETTFDHYRIVPRAKIVAHLLTYHRLVPAKWLETLTLETVKAIEATDPLRDKGGDDLRYTLFLAEAKGLPDGLRTRLHEKLRQMIPAVVARDPAQWQTYCTQPLKAAPRPGSPGAELIAEAVELNLDTIIQNQLPEGTWDPVWTWSGQYPQDWEVARHEWRGQITLETLNQLKAYGRLSI